MKIRHKKHILVSFFTNPYVISFFLFISIPILILTPAPAQSLDSLKLLLSISKPDTNRINLYLKLSSKYNNLGIYDTALHIADSALYLSEKQKFKKGIAKSYNMCGSGYFIQGNYDKCLDFYLKSLKSWEEIRDSSKGGSISEEKKNIAATYNNIGNVYYAQGDYGRCLDFHFKSLKIREEIGDKKGIAYSYNNIGGGILHKAITAGVWTFI